MSSKRRHTPDISEEQWDLLQSAVREGYFNVPREVTLVDLAERHGLSDRDASEQIRRGLDVLVRGATRDQ
jgi:predicted DNA binding protein